MGLFLLIGHHIGYSASPAMQNAAFAALALDHRYDLADVEEAGLPTVMAALRDGETLGANVTAPHKLGIADLVDDLDAGAARVGAVNTVVRAADGRLTGMNTDLPALVDALRELRADARHAVVLGGGGASRAVLLALEDAGAQRITRVSRLDWSHIPDFLADADLLVNATPIGTGSDESPVDAALLRADLAVLDLVYRPNPTRLIRDARASGAMAKTGAGVLLGQGWRSLEAWLGVERAPIEAMRAALRAELGPGTDV
ncbi:MAG: shikimate dehydrogenase [Candidatus Limnocylindrales bacterium]